MIMGDLGEAACWNPKMRSVCWKSKKSTPQTNSLDPESSCRRFQSFYYPEAVESLQAISLLLELCCQWLRPEIHSEILELLVLTILPRELQSQMQKHHPQSIEAAVALVQHFHRESGQRKNEVRRKILDIHNKIGMRWI
uniref:SCAN box domain-containing protein n=1 Tax=Loxodonta africana TaxID=9785 RepID=G3UC70_LOXAF